MEAAELCLQVAVAGTVAVAAEEERGSETDRAGEGVGWVAAATEAAVTILVAEERVM